jgi:hypothetical protein
MYKDIYKIINKEIRTPSRGRARRSSYTFVWQELGQKVDEAKGIGLKFFMEEIRKFYDDSQEHHIRLAYQTAIADRLGLNLRSQTDIDKMWERVAKDQNVPYKESRQWKSGLEDPNTLYAIKYWFNICDYSDNHPQLILDDPIERMRLAISRTLMFIAVYPPKEDAKTCLAADAVPTEFRECWQELKKHPHYCERKRQLNQHALDSVRELLGPSHWLEPHVIGKLKREMETLLLGSSEIDHPYMLPWIIFKFTTSADIRPARRKKRNENSIIWNENHSSHSALWR